MKGDDVVSGVRETCATELDELGIDPKPVC